MTVQPGRVDHSQPPPLNLHKQLAQAHPAWLPDCHSLLQEGAELEALEALDLDLVTFDVTVVDTNHEKDRAVVSLLQNAGCNHDGAVERPQVKNSWWGTGASHILLQLQSAGLNQSAAGSKGITMCQWQVWTVASMTLWRTCWKMLHLVLES